MHKQRLFIAIAGAIGVVSAFLPWASVSFGPFSTSVSGTQGGDGWVSLAIFAAAIGISAAAGDKNSELDAKMKKAVAGIGGAAVAFMAYELISILGAGFGASVGIGIWLSLVAGLGVLVVPFAVKGDGSFEMPNKESVTADLNTDNPDASGSEE